MERIRRTSIIRQRGQLTIPGAIRQAAQWTHALAVVAIFLDDPRRIVIEPHTDKQSKNWEALRKEMEAIRKLTATGKGGSASAFIARDRKRH